MSTFTHAPDFTPQAREVVETEAHKAVVEVITLYRYFTPDRLATEVLRTLRDVTDNNGEDW